MSEKFPQGGWRPGAGRKRKETAPILEPEVEKRHGRAPAPPIPSGRVTMEDMETAAEYAQQRMRDGIDALALIVTDGTNEAARVSAAKALYAIAYGSTKIGRPSKQKETEKDDSVDPWAAILKKPKNDLEDKHRN